MRSWLPSGATLNRPGLNRRSPWVLRRSVRSKTSRDSLTHETSPMSASAKRATSTGLSGRSSSTVKSPVLPWAEVMVSATRWPCGESCTWRIRASRKKSSTAKALAPQSRRA